MHMPGEPWAWATGDAVTGLCAAPRPCWAHGHPGKLPQNVIQFAFSFTEPNSDVPPVPLGKTGRCVQHSHLCDLFILSFESKRCMGIFKAIPICQWLGNWTPGWKLNLLMIRTLLSRGVKGWDAEQWHKENILNESIPQRSQHRTPDSACQDKKVWKSAFGKLQRFLSEGQFHRQLSLQLEGRQE